MALNRILGKLDQTEKIAEGAIQELVKQNAKLIVLDEKLNKIETLNKRTGKYVKSLGKAIVTDKLHLFLSLFIVLNLILLIVIVATGWNEFFP